VWIEAVDDSGYLGPRSPEEWATTENLNWPELPAGLALEAEPELGGARASWDAVTENADPIPGADPTLRDLAGYRLERSHDNWTNSDLIADVADLPAGAQPGFHDRRMVRCRPYQYRVSSVDTCGRAAEEESEPVEITLPPGAPSVKPTNLQAFFQPGSIVLTWDEVTRDTDGIPVWVEEYKVYKSGPFQRGSFQPPYSPIGQTLGGATTYELPLTLGPNQTVYFTVKATDPCPTQSEFSDGAEPTCSFSGHVRILEPANGQVTAGGTTVRVDVENGIGPYTGLTLDFVHADTGDVETHAVSGAPPWSFSWDAGGQAGDGTYTIAATVGQTDGTIECTQVRSIRVGVGGPPE
jgi:hypothetical protein